MTAEQVSRPAPEVPFCTAGGSAAAVVLARLAPSVASAAPGGKGLPIFTKRAIFPVTVKNRPIVTIKGALEKEAIRILREVPGVTLEVEPILPGGRRPDIVVRAGDVTHVVEVKAQRVTNAAAARQLADYAREISCKTRLLLIAQSTTEEARQLLEDAGVAVIDGLGNMRVELPGMFLWAEGRTPGAAVGRIPGQPPVRLTGRAGVAAQALLREPQRQWRVNGLAEEAAISTALAHRVLARLERESLVAAEGAGPRRIRHLTNPTALLDLWAEEMRDRKVRQVRAFRLARDPRTQAKTLSKDLDGANIEHAVTGPAGAVQLAPYITAIPVTDVWVAETTRLEDAAAAAGAEIVTDGHNIVLRQAVGDEPLVFREKVEGIWTANRFRLFLDLRHDPRRGREQADRLREEVIGF